MTNQSSGAALKSWQDHTHTHTGLSTSDSSCSRSVLCGCVGISISALPCTMHGPQNTYFPSNCKKQPSYSRSLWPCAPDAYGHMATRLSPRAEGHYCRIKRLNGRSGRKHSDRKWWAQHSITESGPGETIKNYTACLVLNAATLAYVIAGMRVASRGWKK